MEKWRCILWIGTILGIGVQILDFLVKGILPYVIIIPIEIVAIVLIFSGFIVRKIEKKKEK